MFWTVAAGDAAGTLQQHHIKNGDTVIVKFLLDDKNIMTQEQFDDISEMFQQTFKQLNIECQVAFIPIPVGADISVNTLTDEEKSDLRDIMRQLGVIE